MNFKENPFYLTDEQNAWVEEKKTALTMEQKIGQMFCVMGGDYSSGIVEDDAPKRCNEGGLGNTCQAETTRV